MEIGDRYIQVEAELNWRSNEIISIRTWIALHARNVVFPGHVEMQASWSVSKYKTEVLWESESENENTKQSWKKGEHLRPHLSKCMTKRRESVLH